MSSGNAASDEFALIGLHQFGFDITENEDQIDVYTRHMLARYLNNQNVIAFVGSGVSRAYGYPTWDQFTKELVHYTVWCSKEDKETEDYVPMYALTEDFKPRHYKVNPTENEIHILNSFIDKVDSVKDKKYESPLSREDQTLVILDLCEGLFSRSENSEKARDGLRDYMAQIFKTKREQRHKEDPLREIIESLRIRRFITTNYDEAIEDAFRNICGCRILDGKDNPLSSQESTNQPKKDKKILPTARSLILDPENAETLIQFAVAAPGFEQGVLHIHGKAPSNMLVTERDYQKMYLQGIEPYHMVVTERDYQKIYLQEIEPYHRIYREALKIIFEGNAVLFLGLGFKEDELLRSLRQFSAEKAHIGYERPLFVLWPRPKQKGEATEFRRFLYARFAVKVIYYDVPNDNRRTEYFVSAIKDLKSTGQNWWENWRRKPLVRKPEFSHPKIDGENRQPIELKNCMIRHASYEHLDPTFRAAEPQDYDLLSNAIEDAENRGTNASASLIFLGRDGAGKGTIAQRLIIDKSRTAKAAGVMGKKFFFATAHFSNDLLSIIDAAANFFLDQDSQHEEKSPLERLKLGLESGRHLLAIGGLERLLMPAGENWNEQQNGDQVVDEAPNDERLTYPNGKPLTYEVRRFLELLNHATEKKIKGTIVVTSSVFPIGLSRTKVKQYPLEAASQDSIRKIFKSLSIEDQDINELHAALNGHSYALSVIYKALKLHSLTDEEKRQNIKEYIAKLTAIDMEARPIKTIELAMEMMANGNYQKLKDLVQRVALFSTPVEVDEIFCSYSPETAPCTRDEMKQEIKTLVDANILIEQNDHRIRAHTLVRSYALEELGEMALTAGEAQRFDLTGWSRGVPETLVGRGDSHKLTCEAIDALLKEIEKNKNLQREEEKNRQRGIVRAVFGLIRSRWTATAIPRVHNVEPDDKKSDMEILRAHYDDYQMRLSKLMNAIRNASSRVEEGLWLEKPLSRSRIEKKEGHLYADELAWLYNELVQVAFCQGFVEDAKALLMMSQMVSAVAERGTHGHRWCEAEITLGLVQMEMGNLDLAHKHLTSTLRIADESLHDPELVARARGHLALVLHLEGHFGDAQGLYKKALDELSKSATDNLRAISIFYRHRGDLLRRLEKWEAAKDDLQQSIAAAQSGRYPDLMHYARVAQANFELMSKKKDAVKDVSEGHVESLAVSLDFARRVGIPKLEWEVQNVQAEMALKQGEFELAEKLSVSNLAIASALGLKLRLTRSLFLAGEVAAERGDHSAANHYFQSVRELAERQRYQLLIEDAERRLRKAPV